MKQTALPLLITFLFAALMAPLSIAAEEQASGTLSGAFSSWGKSSLSGDWAIVKDGEEHYIVLGENFSAKKGPDVKVFLSPTSSSDVSGDNAMEGSVFIKLLDDFSGSARIKLPADIDLSKYQSLVFHCEEYSKLWGSSALR